MQGSDVADLLGTDLTLKLADVMLAHKADVIRLFLLANYGGIWYVRRSPTCLLAPSDLCPPEPSLTFSPSSGPRADMDVAPIRPLEDWIFRAVEQRANQTSYHQANHNKRLIMLRFTGAFGRNHRVRAFGARGRTDDAHCRGALA